MSGSEALLGNEQPQAGSPSGQRKHEHHVHHGASTAHDQELWDKYECQDLPNVFSHLGLATDGGFSEVKNLYYGTRWVSALVLIVFVLYNIEALVMLDVQLMGPNAEAAITAMGGDPTEVMGKDTFYFSKGIISWVVVKVSGDEDLHISPVKLLGALELVGLLGYLGQTLYHCVYIKIDTGFKRWYGVQTIFWDIFPSLSTYSAMKLLYYIVPAVLSTRLSEIIEEFKERKAEQKSVFPAVGGLLLYIFLTVFGFVAGFDTFLLKLRCTAAKADEFDGVLPCIQFLVQVLGVVQLGPFVRKRLFVFIFGGEDGIMQDEETDLMYTWNALLARRMWRDLPRAHFFAVMLSFADVDFQSLVLNENDEEKKKQLGS